ncbi:hypothetical protein ABZ807_33095 [Micromonospora sp. NPDC047548]|uniref:hypothetical protein n=1 Tax=Micromonospora sp. NPDC047548 TaxID=3155624 RepID=UPI0033EEA978
MDGAYIRRWREDVTACLDRLLPGFEVRFGYPPGRHTIGGPAGEEELASLAGTRLSGDLLEWYGQVREVSLPDIGNGYFIHDPGLVARREVTSIRGRFAAEVIVFASDGGRHPVRGGRGDRLAGVPASCRRDRRRFLPQR